MAECAVLGWKINSYVKSILKINNRTTILLLIFYKTEKCKKKGCILKNFEKMKIIVDMLSI